MTNLARLHLPLRLVQRQRLHGGRAAIEAPAGGRVVVFHGVAAGAVVGQLLAGRWGRGVVGRGPVVAAGAVGGLLG